MACYLPLAKANGNRNPLEEQTYCRRETCSTGKNTLLQESKLFYREKYLIGGEQPVLPGKIPCCRRVTCSAGEYLPGAFCCRQIYLTVKEGPPLCRRDFSPGGHPAEVHLFHRSIPKPLILIFIHYPYCLLNKLKLDLSGA